MYIRKSYKLLKLSEAKSRLEAGEEVYKQSKDRYRHYLISRPTQLEINNIYELVYTEDINTLELDGLFVYKKEDGKTDFDVCVDYDIYGVGLSKQQTKELIKFLKSPFKSKPKKPNTITKAQFEEHQRLTAMDTRHDF